MFFLPCSISSVLAGVARSAQPSAELGKALSEGSEHRANQIAVTQLYKFNKSMSLCVDCVPRAL